MTEELREHKNTKLKMIICMLNNKFKIVTEYTKSLLLTILVFFILLDRSYADDVTMNSTDGYDVQYAMTYMVDVCGDTEFGKWNREAIVAKVEECPFTEAAKKNFYKKALRASNGIMAEMITYFKTHQTMPTKTYSETIICSELLSRPSVIGYKNKLKQYYSGKIKLDELVPDIGDCIAGSKFIDSPTAITNQKK